MGTLPEKKLSSTVAALERLLEELRRGHPDDELLSDEVALTILRIGGHLYAQRRRMSERTLRRRFERLGVGLAEHLQKTRRKTTLLLLADGLSNPEIARRLGFSCPQSFCRFVRREFHTTPTLLRRRFAGL